MRLCIISHAYLEEAYRHVLEALASYPGVELAWITPDRYKLALQNSSGQLTKSSAIYKTFAVPIYLDGRQGTFLYNHAQLAEAVEEFRPDIILHEQEVFALGGGQVAQLCKRKGIPLVMFVNENLPRSLSFPRRLLRSYVLNRCAGVIAVSRGAEQVHLNWGFRGLIAVLPQMGVQASVTPRFGLRGAGSFHVGFGGRLVPSKGVDLLLRAIARMHESGLSIRCTIAGRGEELGSLIKLAAELGVSSVVDFVGMLRPGALEGLLRSCDVMVLPSRRTKVWEEQFGRILAESMAEATATVGSRTGAIPEVIGSAELTFEENDWKGLSRILTRLALDGDMLIREQERLYRKALDEYVTEVVTSRKVAFLTKVLNDFHAASHKR